MEDNKHQQDNVAHISTDLDKNNNLYKKKDNNHQQIQCDTKDCNRHYHI